MTGPYEVRIGHALITMIEPHPGHDHQYNRWYEDDHFYSGAMAMPWIFAGRRWVAPRELQALRYPDDSPLAQPLSLGKYISTYWITAGRYDEHRQWTSATHRRSLDDGRVVFGWASVYTSFQVYRGVVYRDPRGPRDIHALDYPYQGLVVEVVEGSSSREELLSWLQEDYLPSRLVGSAIAMTMIFEPRLLHPERPSQPPRSALERKPFEPEQLADLDRYVTLLSFTEVRPPECWTKDFARAGDVVESSGRGRVVFAAPFQPTLPGTDAYVDDLR